MGRPLNKKFFQGLAASGFQVGCQAWFTGEGAAESAYIVQQKSNLRYLVESDAGPGTRSEVLQLVQGAPGAAGEMQVTVQPENAVTPAEAQIDFGTTGGVVDSVTLVDGGYGYWTGGTFNITVLSDGGYVAGTEAVITYTVANGSIATVEVTSGGTGYTADLPNTTDVNTGDIPNEAALPPVQNARIINARTVKTFEGNIFDWPITAPLGAGITGMTQADLQETSS
jgi:hypothetical protein